MAFFYAGNIDKSLSYHLFGPAFVFFCMLVVVTLFLERLTKKEYFRKILFNVRAGYIAGLLLGAYHLVRLVFFVMQHNITEIVKESVWK